MGKQNYIYSLGYKVFNGSLEDLPKNRKIMVNTINQYSYCIAENDYGFKNALLKSDVLLPDGIGIVKAVRFLHGHTITKIAGADLHEFLLKMLDSEKGSCFYMGSTENNLVKIKKRLNTEYPNIRVGSYSPPFKKVFSEEDNMAIVNAINSFKPKVLFVGMTAPKQEKWCHVHKDVLDAQLICSIGAVFDFYSGTVQRPNKIWIDLGLEWLGRLIKEPKRMWKRYIYYGFAFGYYMLREKIRTV